MAVNVAMWRKAMRVIPRLTKEEWDVLDLISKWLISTRAAVFIMTELAAGIGGILAFRDGSFHWPYFLAAMVGLVFAHASNNLLNDFIDFKRGLDKDNYYRAQYGPQPLEHGLMSRRQFMGYLSVSLLVALASGIYLSLETGTTTLILLSTGLFFLLFYTWPLKYIGLGELTVILVWGPLMVGGTYYVTTGGSWSWDVALLSLVYSMGPTTVLFGKHTDKLAEDRVKKVYTLPVILKEKMSRYTTIGMWIAQYALVGIMILYRMAGPVMAIVLLAIPKLVSTARVFTRPRPEEAPPDLPPNTWPLYLSANAFGYNKRFGSLFLLGLIIDVVLVKAGVY
jgi:1,4-dihydroxy-2-naphthoate octaprenyltransferase